MIQTSVHEHLQKNTCKTSAQTLTCVLKCIISSALFYILLENLVTETFQSLNIS